MGIGECRRGGPGEFLETLLVLLGSVKPNLTEPNLIRFCKMLHSGTWLKNLYAEMILELLFS